METITPEPKVNVRTTRKTIKQDKQPSATARSKKLQRAEDINAEEEPEDPALFRRVRIRHWGEQNGPDIDLHPTSRVEDMPITNKSDVTKSRPKISPIHIRQLPQETLHTPTRSTTLDLDDSQAAVDAKEDSTKPTKRLLRAKQTSRRSTRGFTPLRRPPQSSRLASRFIENRNYNLVVLNCRGPAWSQVIGV